MTFIIEDKPVNPLSLVDEATIVLKQLQVGQSFLVPPEIAEPLRSRAKRLGLGKYQARAEVGFVRIGRVA